MAALDFPASPTNGQQYVGPGGVIWVYDLPGTKWISGSLAAGVYVTPSPNLVHNAGFAVNQRVYASGTALAAGIYGHDRWKAGAGGCTCTFAALAGPANTITITAGTLQQVVEGAALVGGNYRLSWTGTAQGRVGAGSYAASPVSVAGIVAGANTTIEFNAGTLGQVKFEAGTVVTQWQPLDPMDDLHRCQRFYWATGTAVVAGNASQAAFNAWSRVSFPTMRAVPIMNWNTTGPTNITSAAVMNVSLTGADLYLTSTGTGFCGVTFTAVTASADL